MQADDLPLQHAIMRAHIERAAVLTTALIMPHSRVVLHDLNRRLLHSRSVRARRGTYSDAHLTIDAHLELRLLPLWLAG